MAHFVLMLPVACVPWNSYCTANCAPAVETSPAFLISSGTISSNSRSILDPRVINISPNSCMAQREVPLRS